MALGSKSMRTGEASWGAGQREVQAVSLSPPPPVRRPGERGVVAGLVPAEPASAASRPQVHGGGPAATGPVPARAARLPAFLLGPGCPRHLAHQHHPCPCPLLQVGAPRHPVGPLFASFLTGFLEETKASVHGSPPAGLPMLSPTGCFQSWTSAGSSLCPQLSER